MAIAVTATKQTVSNYYVSLATWVGMATGFPGSGTTPANEASGGSYGRAQTAWTPGSGGINTGSAVTINMPAGTFTYGLLASASTVATANMVDNCPIGTVVLASATTMIATPVFTQT